MLTATEGNDELEEAEGHFEAKAAKEGQKDLSPNPGHENEPDDDDEDDDSVGSERTAATEVVTSRRRRRKKKNEAMLVKLAKAETLTEVHVQIAAMLAGKLKSDRSDDRDGKHRRPFKAYVKSYMTRQYGLRKLANK